ncbi:MAG TPA: hypothetical protein VGD37_02040 [Kofleriaceae bacterium]
MSLRTLSLGLVASLVLGCGGGPPRSDEPTTAKEKQRREAAAAGEAGPNAGKWGGWRYTGDRDECFFLVGRRCFKTEASACAAARCGKRTCETRGGGPATVACAK